MVSSEAAVITGASSGIGEAVARALLARGLTVVTLQRVGTPQDIARAVLFFLDRENGFITGQALFVCGGTSITGTSGA